MRERVSAIPKERTGKRGCQLNNKVAQVGPYKRRSVCSRSSLSGGYRPAPELGSLPQSPRRSRRSAWDPRRGTLAPFPTLGHGICSCESRTTLRWQEGRRDTTRCDERKVGGEESWRGRKVLGLEMPKDQESVSYTTDR